MNISNLSCKELEKMRDEKAKELGYICYNISVDNKGVFKELLEDINCIKEYFSKISMFKKNGIAEKYITQYMESADDKAMEIGYLCFNMYVDKKLDFENMTNICEEISEISKAIYNAKNNGGNMENVSNNDYGKYEAANNAEAYSNKNNKESKIDNSVKIEPIPNDFKQCLCGYKNKKIALYCGKCGLKL